MTDPTPRRRGRPRATDAAEAPRVEAVERALSLLETFADGRPRLSLAEMAQRAGLYPSTVLRLAASLAQFGYLRRDQDGMFRLGPAPMRLGALYQAGFNLAEVLRPAPPAVGRTPLFSRTTMTILAISPAPAEDLVVRTLRDRSLLPRLHQMTTLR